MSLQSYSKEELLEMSLLELAYELLVEKNAPLLFDDLVNEIAALQGVSKEEIRSKIPQFYTDLNVNGRFTCLGENRWGLKTWYPVDQIEDEVVHVVKPKKKKAKKASIVEDDFDELDEEDLDFEDDIEDLDEDEDDLLDDPLDEDIDDDLVEDEDEDEDDLKDALIDDDEFELDEEEEEEEDFDDEVEKE
ncbi:DNA-directed RNA polymerase subunit delta [Peribacillus huizhouensis]|uniref:Probable DNA-directed RNA polymerase subunit delta n=1 Tax=Peribacillus huizhouensis TaxID=1501239 RepID=A0ABR6CS94_9BACI|nr:DNA-directed RNA polymerase subunit delta [Peribacillus huizhouensis]